jgi:nicotinate-nucleotide adenylyltransferase
MILPQPNLNDPKPWAGKRIGLLGGSFNPAHRGHLHIAKMAMRKFGLDYVWWLITPQNPLKSSKVMASYDRRYESVQKLTAPYPLMLPTHLERDLGTKYTFETITKLKASFPETKFLFICGMDNAVIFHKWDRWEDLIHELPIVFIARPGSEELIDFVPVRLQDDVPQHEMAMGKLTNLTNPGIYWLENARTVQLSSTEIRSKIKWL